MLGYKAYPGFVIYRVRIRRGGRRRPERKGVIWGKPANHGINQIKNRKNLQSIAEDGSSKWFEVILVDPRHKRIQADPKINWIVRAKHTRREARGKTSAGRKHRGLRKKGHFARSARPSRRAAWKRNNRTQLWRYR